MTADPTVFVVDDDADILRSLRFLIQSVRMPVETFESAESFLETYKAARPGCLLLDIRMPGMGGLKLLEHLQKLGIHLPVIIMTGHGDVPMVLQAWNSGAFAFLEKPATHQQILDYIHEALESDRAMRAKELERESFEKLLAQLSPREHEVLDWMVEGKPNKVIALELGISERTLEKHRKHIVDKLEARSLAELIRRMLLHQSIGKRAGKDTNLLPSP